MRTLTFMKLFKKYIFLFYLNIILSQLVPYEEPLSKDHQIKTTFFNIEEIINTNIQIECFTTSNKESICQLGIKFNEKNLHILELSINQNISSGSFFMLDYKNNNIFSGSFISLIIPKVLFIPFFIFFLFVFLVLFSTI